MNENIDINIIEDSFKLELMDENSKVDFLNKHFDNKLYYLNKGHIYIKNTNINILNNVQEVLKTFNIKSNIISKKNNLNLKLGILPIDLVHGK